MNVHRITIDRPGWAWRVAFGIIAFIIVLPLVLLVLLVLLAVVAALGMRALITNALGRMKTTFEGSDGRHNVRVIVRD